MSRAAVVAGLGAFVPPRVVTNHELAQRHDTSDEWIRSRTGIGERRVVDPGVATGDLAVEAAGRALKSAAARGVAGADLVILATTTPDRPCPATAPDVATRLGLDHVPAFDIAAVCSGFVYGLAMGAGAVAAGLAARVLVVGAETFTTILNPADRTTACVFGDGAGAVVLRAGEASEAGALLEFDLGSDGSQAELLMIPAGGSRQRSSGIPAVPEDAYFAMQGRPVFQSAVLRMAASSRAAVRRTGWDLASIDWLVGHQANARILHAVADQLELPRERAVLNLDKVGNTSAASIPLALAAGLAAGSFRVGDRMVLTAFGGGTTWGSATFTWPALDPV